MGDPAVICQDFGAVRRLVLNMPDRFNLLSDAMLDALETEIARLAGSTARVVILAAQGRAFCAGHDLKEMQARRSADASATERAFQALFSRCGQMMQSLQSLTQPVIAEVQGIATAAGCQLVASCDMAIASETAKFGVNGIDVGLFCSTPMVALTRKIPPAAAFEMLTTGSFIPALRAMELGLVNRVTAPEILGETVLSIAEVMASKSPSSLALGKEGFYRQLALPLDEAYRQMASAMARNMMFDATDALIDGFIHRKSPKP